MYEEDVIPSNSVLQEIKPKNIAKRQRSENWCEVDKELLKDLIRKKVKDIENKNTDTNTNQRKKRAWLEIENNFNSLCSSEKRTIHQLKTQWTTIKVNAKKLVSEHRASVKKTGGGEGPTEIPLSGSDISIWLPNEFVVDNNQYDSDVILIKDNDKTEENDVIIEEIPPVCKEITSNETTKMVETKTNEKVSLYQKKKIFSEKRNVTDESIKKIADADVECRKELHLLQIEAETKRIRNLDLEFELIQSRLNFYKKKSFGTYLIALQRSVIEI